MPQITLLEATELDDSGDLPVTASEKTLADEDAQISGHWERTENALFRIYVNGAVTGSPDVEFFLEGEYVHSGGDGVYWKEIAGSRLSVQSPSDEDAFHAELGKVGKISKVRLNGSVTTLNGSNKLTIDAYVDVAASVRFTK